MIKAKKNALLWLLSGLVCALLLLLVVFTGLSGTVMITDREGIQEAADTVMHCIRAGNWEALESAVIGSHALSPLTGEADSAETLIWDAYRNSLNWTCKNGFEIQNSCVNQKLTVSCLDIPQITSEMAGILSSTNTSDPEQQAAALRAAAQKVLDTAAPVTEREITLTFQRDNGQWLLVPNGALQALLSGFTAP